MHCKICGRDPCSCALAGQIAGEFASIQSEDDAMGLLRTLFPHAGTEPIEAEVFLKLLTNPQSPLKMTDEQLVSFSKRLHELALDAPTKRPTIPQVWNAIELDLSVPAQRVGQALAFLVEETAALVESHPLISNHRAFIIDQAIRILAGDRYAALRWAAFGDDYNEGIEPPGVESRAESPS